MHAIGTASKLSGIHIETIRYYEREGILPEPERLASGRRCYDDAAIARMRFVRRCKELGFPVRDAQALLQAASSPLTCQKAKAIAEKNLAVVRLKIQELGALEKELTDLVGLCNDESDDCTMLLQLLSDEG